MIPVPPQQASKELEHSQNDGKHGDSVVNNIIFSQNTIYATNSNGVGISLSTSRNEVEAIRNMVLVFEGLKRPLDPYDCFHIEVVDQIIRKPFIESSLTDPTENIDTLTAQTKDH
ncbi:hypothetical protein L3X38_039552 [Prunus dulcis]|uniref:Uncharacterized protein n=1 Tax=Prunus dulcis TaxID=3755 RepID=A0AAD4V7D0_PRUDU|nr:hypothetical protein L3X38_039552 [Prunus dulcis]